MIEAGLIETLAMADPARRRSAAQEIGETGDPDAPSVLLAQLEREYVRSVKQAILSCLGQLWAAGPVDGIVELLRDSDPYVRAEASEMLRRREADAFDGLSELVVHGKDKDLRKFAIDILGQAPEGAPDAVCLAALKDIDINVVISTIENIGLGRRRAFLRPVLQIALSKPHPMAMCACLETLGLIGDRATLDALRGQFPDACKVPELFLLPFLKLLGGTAGPEAIDEICRLIASRSTDGGPSIQAAAVDALTGIVSRCQDARLSAASEAVLLGLLHRAHDSGHESRHDAESKFHNVRLLGHFASSQTVALALLPLLDSPDPALCLTVVEALADSSDPQVAAALHELLAAETDPEMIENLEEILGRRAHWNSLPINSRS